MHNSISILYSFFLRRFTTLSAWDCLGSAKIKNATFLFSGLFAVFGGFFVFFAGDFFWGVHDILTSAEL